MEEGFPKRFRVTRDVLLDAPVDEAARVKLVPAHMTTKGMYLRDLAARVGDEELARITPTLQRPPRGGVYQPFLAYPFADATVLLHAVAKREHADLPLLEGMRRLGRDTVRVFLASHAGRVVRHMAPTTKESLLRMPEMWRVTDPESQVTAVEVGERAVRFVVYGFPAWLDCGVIGTLEQVVLNHRAEPVIDAELHEATVGALEVSWQPHASP